VVALKRQLARVKNRQSSPRAGNGPVIGPRPFLTAGVQRTKPTSAVRPACTSLSADDNGPDWTSSARFQMNWP